MFMAQRRHVPKFGNFESDNDIEYTAYFETGQIDKAIGTRINQNDPKESPESPMYAKKGGSNDNFPPLSVDRSSDKSGSVKRKKKNHHRNNLRSITLESGNDRSIPNNFLNRNHGKDIQKKKVVDSDYYVSSSLEYNSPSNVLDMAYGSASVPKFGAWDEKDATSGEGFTVLFNKVKEEKQIAASKFPAVPLQVVTHTKAYNEKKNLKPKSKKATKVVDENVNSNKKKILSPK